ncbi:MAG: M3 family metallopeptidase, partial [Chloroflexota bacterium]
MVDATPAVKNGAENVIWDLSVFYSAVNDPQIDADMKALETDINAFADQYRGKVATLSAAELAAAMETREALYDRLVRLGAFAQLNYAADSADDAIGALVQKVMQFSSRLEQQSVFFDLEWQAADDAHVETVLADDAIAKYRHLLEAELRYRPYTLSEPEEKVMVALNVAGRSAWTRFFQKLQGAMRYDWDGEKITLSEILDKTRNADRDIRARAAESVTAGLKDKNMELTYIFNVLASDKAIKDDLRGYPSWVTSRNLSNKAPDEVVEALISTVTSSYDLVARHYNLKRVLPGLDELTDYDRYAPLPIKAGEKNYQWGEARDIVLNAFGQFSPQMSEIAGYFFEKNWIHAPVQPHKRGGAFSASTTPGANPFILVNFLGNSRDVSTLAHELGHGIHQYLAAQHQGLMGSSTPLTTAEMA